MWIIFGFKDILNLILMKSNSFRPGSFLMIHMSTLGVIRLTRAVFAAQPLSLLCRGKLNS